MINTQMQSFQPTLRGKLVQLRPLKDFDHDALFIVASDPLIWEVHPVPDRYKPEGFKKYFDFIINTGGALAVEDLKGNLIGSSSFYGLNPQASEIIIGYTFLARKYWGGKYNKDLKSLMLNHAFQFVDTAIFEIGEQNIRSRRAIEKIGGQFLRSKIKENKPYVVYQIRKS